jgi:AhpD family alkylhydroperoxidase
MQTRPNTYQLAPEIPKLGAALQQAIEATGLSSTLTHLIQIRVSQLNGCAYCIHMHIHDARRDGESELRIHVLTAWRESTLFSASERAVLAWAEALTLVATRGAPDHALFDALKQHFSDKEIVGITSSVAMINFWNRMALGSAAVSPHEKQAGR